MSGRYPLMSSLLLLSIPVSCLISYMIFQHQNYAWVNAIGLLVVPFAVFCWVFTTIRAIHLVDVQFWFIPSTYVALIGGVISLMICLIVACFSEVAESKGHHVEDITLYLVAAILYGGCALWSYFYNWRKTGSSILAVSLTLIQTISAASIIGLLYLWIDGRNTKRYERDHGIS